MNSWLHPANTANWQTTELFFELLGIRLGWESFESAILKLATGGRQSLKNRETAGARDV